MRSSASRLRSVFATLLASALVLGAAAQGHRAPPLESPVVHPDRTVTFRLRATEALKVELSGQFLPAKLPMQKDEAGLWTITVGPIEPNLYPYNFVVDGVGVADPANPDVFPNERFKASLVDIPGETPSLHAVRSVPRGEVTYRFYDSRALNRTRPYLVYTPPDYRASGAKYPVLYLVSGTTDTEETWFRAGRVNVILDNLIAEGKAVPMIVVMPYGNMLSGMPDPNTPQVAAMYRAFCDELLGEIVPRVEADYRIVTDREHRAIAGFSRGGGQALFTALSHPDKFAWIASYSAFLTPEVCETHFAGFFARPDETNARLRLLWLGVGRSDFLYQQAVAFEGFLTEKKIEHATLVTDGGHTWMNARHYLAETLQRFFKE
ncbi:MAG: esterase [Opitutaceae bacterium]|nr:esterase [Opitutaceae bacterium]